MKEEEARGMKLSKKYLMYPILNPSRAVEVGKYQ